MAEMQIRPATNADIDMIHAELMDVIASSPHYNDIFKAHEMGRLTKPFLRALIAHDPWHIMIMMSDGKAGGAMVSGPEYGAIFRYWSWVFPKFRDTKLGMFGMRAFDEHWDNGRFHKAYTFVRPENEVALLLLRRYGYKALFTMEKHLFGQDYVFVEKQYTKVSEGYDHGVNLGRLGRLKQRLGNLVGRRSPHPPFGHLLPQGEKGIEPKPQSSPLAPCGRGTACDAFSGASRVRGVLRPPC